MNSTHIGFIKNHLAEALFDRGYLYRQPEQVGESIIEHRRSQLYGNRARNKSTPLKLYQLDLFLRQKADR